MIVYTYAVITWIGSGRVQTSDLTVHTAAIKSHIVVATTHEIAIVVCIAAVGSHALAVISHIVTALVHAENIVAHAHPFKKKGKIYF